MSLRNRFGVVLALLLLLTAQGANAAQKGFLVATTAFNLSSGTANFLTWRLIALDSQGKEHRLEARHATNLRTLVFAETLPVDEYQLVRVAGGFDDRELISAEGLALKFRVEPDVVSSLGQLAVIQDESGDRKPRLAAHAATREIEWLRPTFPAAFASKPLSSAWPGETLGLLESAYQQTQIPAGAFSSPSRDASGRLFAGSGFGRVLIREVDGSWSVASTGTSFEILSVLPLADGRLLAGSEAGGLQLANPERTLWTGVRSPSSGPILALGLLPSGSIYLAAQEGMQVKFYAADKELQSWRALGQLEFAAGSQAKSWVLGGRVQVRTTSYGFAAYAPLATLGFYDEATQLWTTQQAENEIQHFWAWKDVAYYTSTGEDVETVYRSNDRGKTWKALFTVALFSSSVCYVAPGVAYKVLTDTRKKDGKNVYSHRLYRTGDDGLNWQPVSRFLSSSGDFHALDDQGAKVVTVIKESLVFGSGSSEKPWNAEYPPWLVTQMNTPKPAADAEPAKAP